MDIVDNFHEIRATTYNKDNVVIVTIDTEIDYENGVIDKTFTNHYPASGRTRMRRDRHQFDKLCRITRMEIDAVTGVEHIDIHYNDKGMIVSSSGIMGGFDFFTEYAYDADERLISKYHSYKRGDPPVKDFDEIVKYSYDSVGSLHSTAIEKEIFSSDSNKKLEIETTNIKYITDDNGRITQRLVSPARSRVKSASYNYDTNGNMTCITYLSGEILGQRSEAYKYDDNGNRIITTYITDGSMTEKTIFEYEKSRLPAIRKPFDDPIYLY